jgi:hypothetical protein
MDDSDITEYVFILLLFFLLPNQEEKRQPAIKLSVNSL